MRSGERFKIGFTESPRKRQTQLQTGNPEPVYLLGVIEGQRADEERLHAEYAHKRTRGEWFALTWEDVQAVLTGGMRLAVGCGKRGHERIACGTCGVTCCHAPGAFDAWEDAVFGRPGPCAECVARDEAIDDWARAQSLCA